MSESMEEDKVTIKEEISTIEDMCTVYVVGEDVKEEISTVEDMCTVNVVGEDVKEESTESQGIV